MEAARRIGCSDSCTTLQVLTLVRAEHRNTSPLPSKYQEEKMQSCRSLSHQLKPRIFVPPLAFAAVMLHMAPRAAVTCTDIASLALPNTTITVAQTYVAGETVSGNTKAPAAICPVAARVNTGA